MRRPFRARVWAAAAVLVAAASGGWAAFQTADARENAYRENNRGVALLEQYNYADAAAAFRRALTIAPELSIARVNLAIALLYDGNAEAGATAAQAAAALPNSPHAHYVAGLAARTRGDNDAAIAAFRRVVELDKTDAGSRINLGQMLSQQRSYAEAAALFREALASEPFNATAAYGLATALTRSGSADEGRAAMQRFETLRDAPYAVTYAQTYLSQGRYGEAIASTGAEPDVVNPNPPSVTFADASESMLPSSARAAKTFAAADKSDDSGSLSLADLDGDGDLDAFVVASVGPRFFLNPGAASKPFVDVTSARGLDQATGRAAIAGDYDNDRRADLLLLSAGGPRLLHQRVDGTFDDVSEKAAMPRTANVANSGAFADVDHDGDLDVFVAGAGSPNHLLRNNGDGTFAEIAVPSGVADGSTHAIAVAPSDFDDRRDIDLIVLGASGAPRLFQNMRDGTFRDSAASVGFPREGSYSALAAGDVNKDSYPDFYFGRTGAPGTLVLSDGHARFAAGTQPETPPGVTAAQFVDYDNDGLLDLFTASGRTLRLFRSAGATWMDVSDRAGLAALASGLTGDVRSVAFGDLDRDGDLDALALLTNGHVRYWRNNGGSQHRSLRVDLTGRVSNRFGVGAKIDMRAGSLRQRVETYAATPPLAPSDVVFGLGRRTGADVVRVIWPSGILQAETVGDVRTLAITELDRKPSSCPYLYTWNGSRFTFVTDFMGGGEVGYWMGPGVWNTPDPDEYVRIPPDLLQPRDGRYELRVTNELEEALFVDHLQLVAVDHREDAEAFPNEGLGAPIAAAPFTIARSAQPPRRATDDHGHDVLARLAAIDRSYPDDFTRLDIRGYAESHELRLDLGEGASDAILLATGWTDYAFSSDNKRAHQRGLALAPPSLDARTSTGAWRQVIPEIGIPVGRPQTVVVDLRGKLAPGEREVRIVTNMRIYWDRVLVARGADGPRRVTRVDPSVADLRWRGFSAAVSPDGREPFGYDYDRVSPESPWKTMVGRYTREGDGRDLLRRVDDLFVIARPGDEIALSFDASALPPLGPGERRTFLLYADGYSKEMDITSASPYTVAPVPFHGMTRYPYGANDRYPSTAAHREYDDRYNTRIVRRAIPQEWGQTGVRRGSDEGQTRVRRGSDDRR
jgi:tetratricopeptide (TPR) repeat protein